MPAKRTITASRFVNADTFRVAAIARAVAGARYSGDHFRDADLFRSSQVARSEGVVDMDQFFASAIGTGYANPDELFGANLIAWYRANTGAYNDAGTTLATNTQTVQQWNDQSGNGNHLSNATSNQRPQYLSAGFNSRPTIQFDGALTGLKTAQGVALGTGAAAAMFMVCQMLTGTDGNGRGLVYLGANAADTADAASQIFIQRSASGGNTFLSRRSPDGLFAEEAISLATNYRLGSVRNGTTHTNYINNVAGTPATGLSNSNFGSPGVISVGNALADFSTFDFYFWEGPISEVVVLNIAPDATQRTNLDNWFKQEHGL